MNLFIFIVFYLYIYILIYYYTINKNISLSQELHPVITLCVYYGEIPWDGPLLPLN